MTLGRFLRIAAMVEVPLTLWGQGAAPPHGLTASYVGSVVCKTCHPAMYERWSKTRMANVVTDPKVHPEVIIPDLAKADPLITFKKDESPSSTVRNGSSGTFRKSVTTTFRWEPNGM